MPFLSVAGGLLCILRPAIGLQFVVFFTVLGDGSTWPEYPFVKNLSSQESILFLSGAVKFSPHEACLGALLVGLMLTRLGQHRHRLRRSPLNRSLLLFMVFLATGTAWGLAKGGSWYIASWEVRGLLSLPIIFVVMLNVFDRHEQYQRALSLVLTATIVNVFVALLVLYSKSAAERANLESLIDHGAAVPMNLVFVVLLAALLFRGSSSRRRWTLLAASTPVAIADPRRSAVPVSWRCSACSPSCSRCSGGFDPAPSGEPCRSSSFWGQASSAPPGTRPGRSVSPPRP